MIATDIIKREEYVSSTKGNLKEIPSFLNSEEPKNIIMESDEFKRSLIRNQWRYVKNNYKNNVNVRTILQIGDWYALQNNYKRAIDFYLQAFSLDSENISIYKKIIDILVKHKKFEEAEPYFTQLLSITQRSEILKDYVFFKMLSFNKSSNVDPLIDLIDKTLEKNKEDVDLLSLKGFLILNLKNDIDSAKKIFEICLEKDNHYIHAVNNLGVCYLRKKESKSAEKYFKLGIETGPLNYPFTYQNLAYVYLSEERWKDALNLLDSAVFKNVPLEHEYNHMYGWLLLKDMQLDKAKLWYQNLIKKEPENNLLYNNLGVCYSREKNIDTAISFFQKAVDLCKDQINKGIIKDSRSLHAFYNRGRMAIQKDDAPTIKEISQNILSLDPNNAYGFYFEGDFYLKKTEYEKACASFEKALSISKEIPELYPDYSFILASINKDYKKAISILEQAIKLGYKNDFIFNNLAFSYIKSGELEKGEKIINEHKDSVLPTFIATRGLLEMKKNNLKKGSEYYEKAIESLNDFNKIIASKILEAEIAEYWFRKGNMGLAREHIERAKKFKKTYMDSDVEELEKKLNLYVAK